MRIASFTALLVSAVSLSACGGGGNSSLTSGTKGMSLQCSLEDLSCGTPTGGSGAVTGTTTTTPGTGTSPGGGGAGGNTTNLKTGDTTLVMEGGALVLPSSGTSLSKLSATNAQLLGPTKPSSIAFDVDTNTASNTAWAVSRPMDEYLYGTNKIDAWDTGNRGGANYHEYRLATNEVATKRDDLLQLWSWTDTYATHYRNAISGQEAWSFGGNKTPVTSMPTGGSATYTGRYVGNAVTTDFLKPDGQVIDPNGAWRTQGTARIVANFSTGRVTGTITPETWTVFLKNIAGYFTQNTNGNFYVGDVLAGNNKPGASHLIANGIDYGVPAYYSVIYDTQVTIAGAITGNSYTGNATLSGPWATGSNVMYGGFFGPNATETTGVFDAYGTTFEPIGGSTGINEDRRGHIDIRGAFHGTCTPGVSCAP